MTSPVIHEYEIKTLHDNKDIRKAVIITYGDGFYIDFYKDDVLIDSYNAFGESLSHVESIAKSYIDGIIGIDRRTWKVYGI
jgi:hypothetical protein